MHASAAHDDQMRCCSSSHGTVDDLDDLPAFVTNVRRGRPPPAELVAELRRRYEAIGGARR